MAEYRQSADAAFTRAFRDQFGLTRESVRQQGHLNDIQLMEPIKMDESSLTNLEPPRFLSGPTLLIAALSERYNAETCARIPCSGSALHRISDTSPDRSAGPRLRHALQQRRRGQHGIQSAAWSLRFFPRPRGLRAPRIPEQQYAVFSHRDRVSTIRRTWFTIFNKWLPESGHEIAEAPELEVYGENFDGATGTGGLEIWIPVRK